ncbi:MAG: hypothetical protein HC898_06405 [Phycisphaerales bacterium]|nr:hypothetical protein [Phycisphaerales bacterium]
MTTASLTMSDPQFDRLRKIVYERSGIHFPSAKKYVLESRLSRRLEELEFNNYDEYITFLTVGPYHDDEFQEMFNRITINETSFFRNEPQLDHFEKVTLPRLLETRKPPDACGYGQRHARQGKSLTPLRFSCTAPWAFVCLTGILKCWVRISVKSAWNWRSRANIPITQCVP